MKSNTDVRVQKGQPPDYRTPADMGLYNYNSNWEEPDFGK